MTEQTILQEEQDVVANNIIHAECKGNYTYNDINYISIAKYNKSSKLMKFKTCSDDNISIDSLRMKWTRKYQLNSSPTDIHLCFISRSSVCLIIIVYVMYVMNELSYITTNNIIMLQFMCGS